MGNKVSGRIESVLILGNNRVGIFWGFWCDRVWGLPDNFGTSTAAGFRLGGTVGRYAVTGGGLI